MRGLVHIQVGQSAVGKQLGMEFSIVLVLSAGSQSRYQEEEL